MVCYWPGYWLTYHPRPGLCPGVARETSFKLSRFFRSAYIRSQGLACSPSSIFPFWTVRHEFFFLSVFLFFFLAAFGTSVQRFNLMRTLVLSSTRSQVTWSKTHVRCLGVTEIAARFSEGIMKYNSFRRSGMWRVQPCFRILFKLRTAILSDLTVEMI